MLGLWAFDMLNLNFIFSIMVVLSVVSLSFGQNSTNSRYYFSRIVLPMYASNCKAQITADDIAPNKRSCIFKGHLEIGTKFQLIRERRAGLWTKVTLATDENEELSIYIDRSRGKFQDIFEMVLSPMPFEQSRFGCDAKTKVEVIQLIGFPSSIKRDRNGEVWSYDIEHISSLRGDVCGFDASSVRIKKDGTVLISGII